MSSDGGVRRDLVGIGNQCYTDIGHGVYIPLVPVKY